MNIIRKEINKTACNIYLKLREIDVFRTAFKIFALKYIFCNKSFFYAHYYAFLERKSEMPVDIVV